MSGKEGKSTDAFNSLVFYTNSAVDFGLVGISGTVFDLSMAISATVCEGRVVKILTLIHSF